MSDVSYNLSASGVSGGTLYGQGSGLNAGLAMTMPFQPVLLDLSDPLDATLLIVTLMNRESELRREEQTDPENRAVDGDGWVRSSQELLQEAARLAALRGEIERQLGEGAQ